MAKDLDGAREVVAQHFFEVLAPSRSVRRQAAQCQTDRRQIEPRVKPAAATEADLIRVEFVKVVEDPADSETFLVVERVLKNARGNRAAVEHQMLADHSAAIGEAIWKLLVGGQQ